MSSLQHNDSGVTGRSEPVDCWRWTSSPLKQGLPGVVSGTHSPGRADTVPSGPSRQATAPGHREASGRIAVAYSRTTAAELSTQFVAAAVTKEYRVTVEGKPQVDHGVIEQPLDGRSASPASPSSHVTARPAGPRLLSPSIPGSPTRSAVTAPASATPSPAIAATAQLIRPGSHCAACAWHFAVRVAGGRSTIAAISRRVLHPTVGS